jgi:hypothetical protein
MGNIFFIKPCLTALEEGRSVRFGIFLLMWIIAFVVVIGGIVSWVDFWNQVSGQDAAGVFGVILYQLVFLVLLYFLFQILVIRASDVLNVEAFDSEFTVIPVMSVLTRAAGEFLAVYLVFQGVGWLIYAWFSGATPYISGLGTFENMFGIFSIMSGTGFKAGVISLVRGIIGGFAVIVVAYFWAEAIILGLKWYLDIKKIRKISEGYEKPGMTEAAPAPEEKK